MQKHSVYTFYGLCVVKIMADGFSPEVALVSARLSEAEKKCTKIESVQLKKTKINYHCSLYNQSLVWMQKAAPHNLIVMSAAMVVLDLTTFADVVGKQYVKRG